VCRANTLNEISRSWLQQFRAGRQYALARRGALMMGAAAIGLFARTRPGLDSPDVQYQFLAGSFVRPGEQMHDFPASQATCIPCRPESRGWLRTARPIPLRRPRSNPTTYRPKPTRTPSKICRRGILAGAAAETDEDWLDHIRRTAGTTYHPTSTCMMGAQERAVVDTALRVHGIEGLRVIDASIMPTIVSGNTNAATIMIAEKGAEMILSAARDAGATGRAKAA
jgi:choline dehydrogenase